MEFSTSVLRTAIVTAALTILSVAAVFWYQRKKRLTIPESWKTVGKVKNLYVYPLKSGRRIELQRGECTEYGIRQLKEDAPMYQLRDRSFLVYNEADREFRTARQFPKLVLVELYIHDENHFALNASGMTTLYAKVPKLGKEDEISLFENEKIFMMDCGDNAAQWVSKYLLGKDHGLRLGFHDGKHQRNITRTHKPLLDYYKNLNNESTGLYSDLSSYLLINEASVDELNTKISNSDITFNNFRPNIFVEGAEAFDEDNWDWIKIGTAIFRRVKPCTRCILSTVHPEKGTRDPNREPLKTLETYRLLTDPKARALEGKSPVMGANLGLRKPGIITVGDAILVGYDK